MPIWMSDVFKMPFRPFPKVFIEIERIAKIENEKARKIEEEEKRLEIIKANAEAAEQETVSELEMTSASEMPDADPCEEPTLKNLFKEVETQFQDEIMKSKKTLIDAKVLIQESVKCMRF